MIVFYFIYSIYLFCAAANEAAHETVRLRAKGRRGDQDTHVLQEDRLGQARVQGGATALQAKDCEFFIYFSFNEYTVSKNIFFSK